MKLQKKKIDWEVKLKNWNYKKSIKLQYLDCVHSDRDVCMFFKMYMNVGTIPVNVVVISWKLELSSRKLEQSAGQLEAGTIISWSAGSWNSAAGSWNSGTRTRGPVQGP